MTKVTEYIEFCKKHNDGAHAYQKSKYPTERKWGKWLSEQKKMVRLFKQKDKKIVVSEIEAELCKQNIKEIELANLKKIVKPKYKAIKIKLYPTKKQENILNHWSNCCRFVYNWAISERKKHWDKYEADHKAGKKIPSLSAFDQSRILTEYKKQKENLRLLKCPSSLYTTTLDRVQEGYNLFFREIKKNQKASTPKFCSRNKTPFFTLKFKNSNPICGSFFNESKTILNLKLSTLKDTIKCKIYKEIDLNGVATCTIFKVNNAWFCSLVYLDLENNQLNNFPSESIGIDLGITRNIQFSNSENNFYNLPPLLKTLTQKKDFYNMTMQKAKKGSNNRKKYKEKLIKIHKKIADLRKIDTSILINKIAKENKIICIENLEIKNMTKSAKGTKEKPGKNVNAKSGLNREMLNLAAYSFKERLKRKAREFGSEVVEVDPKYTSQTCSSCGHKDRENRKTQDKFECVQCGFKTNADYNAAKNIEKIGLYEYKKLLKSI